MGGLFLSWYPSVEKSLLVIKDKLIVCSIKKFDLE